MLQALTEPLWALDWRLRTRLLVGRRNQNDLALALTGTVVVMMRYLVALSRDSIPRVWVHECQSVS
jgi:hypothetical protein